MRIIGFAGWSGSGKTTLIERLIPLLTQRGLKVSLIKHAHHHFDIDRPGKDSFRFREAGAAEVLLASSHRWVLMHELRGAPEPRLEDQLRRLAPCDAVLIEGFKFGAIPKIEVWRAAAGEPLLCTSDPNIVAVATDAALPGEAASVSRLDLNDAPEIARFVCEDERFSFSMP